MEPIKFKPFPMQYGPKPCTHCGANLENGVTVWGAPLGKGKKKWTIVCEQCHAQGHHEQYLEPEKPKPGGVVIPDSAGTGPTTTTGGGGMGDFFDAAESALADKDLEMEEVLLNTPGANEPREYEKNSLAWMRENAGWR